MDILMDHAECLNYDGIIDVLKQCKIDDLIDVLDANGEQSGEVNGLIEGMEKLGK